MIVNNNNNTLKYNKRGESDNIATTIWFVCLFFVISNGLQKHYDRRRIALLVANNKQTTSLGSYT